MPTPSENQQLEHLLMTALEALTRDDVRPWIEMFADTGVQEFPYAPPSYPARLIGKAAIADYLAAYPATIHLERIGQPVFYHSEAASVVEFTAEGYTVPTSSPYQMRYISVIEHRAGRITRYIDYWNPLVALTALGGLDALQRLGAGK